MYQVHINAYIPGRCIACGSAYGWDRDARGTLPQMPSQLIPRQAVHEYAYAYACVCQQQCLREFCHRAASRSTQWDFLSQKAPTYIIEVLVYKIVKIQWNDFPNAIHTRRVWGCRERRSCGRMATCQQQPEIRNINDNMSTYIIESLVDLTNDSEIMQFNSIPYQPVWGRWAWSGQWLARGCSTKHGAHSLESADFDPKRA